MTGADGIAPGHSDTPKPAIAEKIESIAGRIDNAIRTMLADYVNQDGWSEETEPHTAASFKLARVTVGLDHLMGIQWGYRAREDHYPRYPEVSLERRGEDDVILRLWAPIGKAHPNRLGLGQQLHEATGLPVEMYGDFMPSKDPGKVEAWRAYRTCDARFPERPERK